MNKKPEVWIIVHKETGQQWFSESGKGSWKKPAHAKSAWSYNYYWEGYEPLLNAAMSEYNVTSKYSLPKEVIRSLNLFENQSDYELKCISQLYVDELLQKIEKMETMIKSEEWKRLKEFVCG